MEEQIHLIDHPLLQHKLCQLRDQNTGVKDFRECVEEVSSLLCYEATRHLPLKEKNIQTPFGPITAREIDDKALAVVAILRAGGGMLGGVLSVLPSVKIGHIGLYRETKTHQLVEYYCKMPTDIASREVLILEPLLARGETASAAISMIKNYSCRHISFLTLVASREAVERLSKDHPDVALYCAAIDEDVNEDGYIVPGVGDAGDRIFGTK